MGRRSKSITQLYRNGIGAILTSLICSVCTCITSQALLALLGEAGRAPEVQSALSVGIFVVGYWVVYFVARGAVQGYLVGNGLVSDRCRVDVGGGAKLFFICASELFWIVSLGVSNLLLLRDGYSAGAAAAISQWGINLLIWLPLLPIWEWFATDWLPKKIVVLGVGGRSCV
jgi:hypothetical protein